MLGRAQLARHHRQLIQVHVGLDAGEISRQSGMDQAVAVQFAGGVGDRRGRTRVCLLVVHALHQEQVLAGSIGSQQVALLFGRRNKAIRSLGQYGRGVAVALAQVTHYHA